MTDIQETHTIRSLAASDARTILLAGLAAAQKLGMAAVVLINPTAFEHPRTRAERLQRADSLRNDARRKVDRLMM